MTSLPLSDFLDRAAKAANKRTVARDLRAVLAPSAQSSEVEVDLDGSSWPYDVDLRRIAGGYRITYPAGARQRFVLSARSYLAAYLYWLDACPPEVRRMTVTASDGDQPSMARFSPSSSSSAQIPIPDPHFFRSRGFAEERQRASQALPWSDRSDTIVWRGVLNGFGRLRFGTEVAADATVNARLRMVALLAGRKGTNIRFSALPEEFARWTSTLADLGYLALPEPPNNWLALKYAIDIDGHANTWSNLLIRMLFGCCVLKVESQLGFRQWYYDRIKPFEHYIPVRADMSDFFEKIEWARSHDKEARDIAKAGQRFATALDFEAGKRDAVDIITANWDKPTQ